MKKGVERIPHRALFYALGFTDEELNRPIIGVVNAHNEIIPGHMHLDDIAEAVKAGIRMAGGTPVEFPAIGVCDGIAMNHEGMFYSLPSREHIDSAPVRRSCIYSELRQDCSRYADGCPAAEHSVHILFRRADAAGLRERKPCRAYKRI